MIRRVPIDDDDEDSPDRWLVSYADFITLLFAFFVVMYAMSSINKSKYETMATSVVGAFSGSSAIKVNPNANNNSSGKHKDQQSTIIKPLPLTYLYQEKIRREQQALTRTAVDISNKLSALIKDGKVHVMQNNLGIRIDINESLLFSPGSAELAPTASAVIGKIANMLKDSQHNIQVEGHTDNIAIHNTTFYSNWELSAVRASSVVRMLSDAGIADNRLSALGFGATQPVADNSSEIGRAKNRRVSIMILYEPVNQGNAALEIKPTETEATKTSSPQN